MTIPARILRAEADQLLGLRKRLSSRHLAREDEIIVAATHFFASYGRCAITFGNLALALRMSGTTLRRYFPDLDSLLQEVLIRHLKTILDAFQSLPPDQATTRAARREAYRSATRGALGLPSPVHLLLTQQRFTLPPDLLQPIEDTLTSIASLLAPGPPDLTLAILDNAYLSPEHAAALLDLPPPQTTPQPEHAPPGDPAPALPHPAPHRREEARRPTTTPGPPRPARIHVMPSRAGP